MNKIHKVYDYIGSDGNLQSKRFNAEKTIDAILAALNESQEPKALEGKCPNFGKSNCICPRCYKEAKPQDKPKEVMHLKECVHYGNPLDVYGNKCLCTCHQESETEWQEIWNNLTPWEKEQFKKLKSLEK